METMTITEAFADSGFHVAVLFVDTEGLSHLTPDCDNAKGETEVVTDYNDRGWFACKCIPVPTPVSEKLRGPSTDAPEGNSLTSTPAQSEKTPWPSDFEKYEFKSLDDVKFFLGQYAHRKLTPADVDGMPNFKRFITEYVMDEANHVMGDGSDNQFLISVADACARYKISSGQAKGVANWIRAQEMRNPSFVKTEDQEISPLNGKLADDSEFRIDLSGENIPSGYYAPPNGDTRLKVKINKPEKGKWKGWIFVSDGAAYGQQVKYGSQRPGQLYKGQINAQLAAIIADPVGAMAAYGHLTGECGKCGRILEVEPSVARGIGPTCAAKMGII